VLDHAKIEAGKLEIRLEAVSLGGLLQRLVHSHRAVASARNLCLTQCIDPRISLSVMADPLRILQILDNLVSNSLKFTAHGSVEVRAELMQRAGSVDTVRLSVKDTGIGIDVEAQRRLFQPFEQAGAVTARLYGGTGLGLSISRRLADMMGGSIQLESVPGEGTQVSLTLPLTAVTEATAEVDEDGASTTAEVPLLQARGVAPRVLAVDDHPTNRELLARQMRALGFDVITAVDGREALEFWEAGGIDALVTDCNMPVVDGYALARDIRRLELERGTPRMPIIAWTANVLPGAAALCRAAGMDDILTKPAELSTLRKMLARWLPLAPGAEPNLDTRATTDASAGARASSILAGLATIGATFSERSEILLDFAAHNRVDFSGLHAAQAAMDYPACVRIAHRMVGSCRMVGAQELAVACHSMERAARRENREDIGLADAAIVSALDQFEADLVALRGASLHP
jgi:two-component system, NarL family, sensor histidine kinase EvgS